MHKRKALYTVIKLIWGKVYRALRDKIIGNSSISLCISKDISGSVLHWRLYSAVY